MEKVRKESQTLMEKVFNQHETMGLVTSQQVVNMMKQMQPEGSYDINELNTIIEDIGRGTGKIDWVGFNKIALHFLLKANKQDHDQFIHKHEIGDADFIE